MTIEKFNLLKTAMERIANGTIDDPEEFAKSILERLKSFGLTIDVEIGKPTLGIKKAP